MVAGYNKTSLTDQNSTVTYTDQDTNSYTNGKTFTTNLSVKLKNEISKVTITKPTKTEYNHGDQIDLTGGKITVTYTDGTTKEESITSAVITNGNDNILFLANGSGQSAAQVGKIINNADVTITNTSKNLKGLVAYDGGEITNNART